MEQVVGVGNGNVCCVLTMGRTLTCGVSFRPISPGVFGVYLQHGNGVHRSTCRIETSRAIELSLDTRYTHNTDDDFMRRD